MSNAIKILPHYTYDDWVNWKGQWELIDGIPYAMSPMPAPKHQQISVALSAALYAALKKCSTCTVYDPLDYKISDDIIVQPDILVVCGKINKQFLDFPPALVVEILSPATALKDRHSKFAIYEQQQVKYFLIVSPDKEEVEIYAIEDGVYQLQHAARDFTYDFSFETDCTASVDFKEIW